MSKKKQLSTSGIGGIPAGYSSPLLSPRKTSHSRTDMIAWMLERKIMELCMNRFEWAGLPDEVFARNIEMPLMQNALAVFHYDEKFGKYFSHFGTPAGNLNMQNDPTEFVAYGNGFYRNLRLGIDECVPIWANYMRMPDIDIIRIYATRLAELDRTIEINSKNARMNKLLMATENTRLSVVNLNRKIEEGDNAIAVEADFEGIDDLIKAFDLGINPAMFGEVSILRGRIWNELMTLLGVNNANQDKKERLVAAEVSGNDDMVEVIRATNLNARKDACKLMETMYGLTVSVEYVTDMNQTAMKDVGSGDQQNRELAEK